MTTTPNSSTDIAVLSEYFRSFWRHRLLIASIVFVATALAVILALVLTPIYRSEVLISVVEEPGTQSDFLSMAGGLGALASLAGINDSSGAAREEALATLASRDFTSQFIETYDLMEVLFHDKWDADAGEWTVKDPEDIPDANDAFARFDKKIRTISVNNRTGLITLAIDWEDRFAAAQWANTLIDEVNLKLRRRAIVEANTSIKYLEEELSKTSIMELRQAIFGLVESQIQKRMLANVRQEYAFKVIDPAVPAAADKEVYPQRVLMVLSAFSVSLFLALALALVLDGLRKPAAV